MTDIYPGYDRKKRGPRGDFFGLIAKKLNVRPVPFSCARSASVYGLRAFGLNRQDEILVPPYLGRCVLSALLRTSFPSLRPSGCTKAIYVYHQFGFLQDIKAIEETARENNWIVVNNAVNALYARTNGESILEWGDFAVLSLSKIYACGLGGAFFSHHPKVLGQALKESRKFQKQHLKMAEKTLADYIRVHRAPLGAQRDHMAEALHGYLPDVRSFPPEVYFRLPASLEEIEQDIGHRKNLWQFIRTRFPDKVPQDNSGNVIPFAVPIRIKAETADDISEKLKRKFSFDVPVLHFDFNRNMLNPDYRKALVIGCHSKWTFDIVKKICDFIEK